MLYEAQRFGAAGRIGDATRLRARGCSVVANCPPGLGRRTVLRPLGDGSAAILGRAGADRAAALPGLTAAGDRVWCWTAALLGATVRRRPLRLLATVLTGDRYPGGDVRATQSTSRPSGRLAVGGALVFLLSTQGALARDALTFIGSALVAGDSDRIRPPQVEKPDPLWSEMTEGFSVVRGDRMCLGPRCARDRRRRLRHDRAEGDSPRPYGPRSATARVRSG